MRAQRGWAEPRSAWRAGDVWFAVHHDWFQSVSTAAGSPACHVAIDLGETIMELRGPGLQALDHDAWMATHHEHHRLDSGLCDECRALLVELAHDLLDRGMTYSYGSLFWSAVEGLLPRRLHTRARRRALRLATPWRTGTCSTFVGDLITRASAGCGCHPFHDRALSPGDLERVLRDLDGTVRRSHPRLERRRAARMER